MYPAIIRPRGISRTSCGSLHSYETSVYRHDRITNIFSNFEKTDLARLRQVDDVPCYIVKFSFKYDGDISKFYAMCSEYIISKRLETGGLHYYEIVSGSPYANCAKSKVHFIIVLFSISIVSYIRIR